MAQIKDEFYGDGFQGDIDYLNSGYNAGNPAEMRLLENILALGGGVGAAQLGAMTPKLAKGAYGVLKGLGNAGEMALGGTPEAVRGAKAVNQGLKALTVPEETVNVLSALGKGPSASDLMAELKVGLQTAKPKDVITLSNGAKWRFDGIQKVGDKSEVLLEHMEGPVPAGVRQGVSTTLSTLESASSAAQPLMAMDIAAQRALNIVEDTNGVTLNLAKGNLAGTPNFSVSIYPERELVVKGDLTTKTIESYMEKNKDLLMNPENSFGVWTNDKGQKVLDVVVTIPDEAKALEFATKHNQDAIWDLLNMKEIRVPKGK